MDGALPPGYGGFLSGLRERIRRARARAGLAVNHELVVLYWDLGRRILERQRMEGWGAKIIDRLAADLRSSFPGVKGFSPRNLKYMRAFAEAYPDRSFVQEVLAQLTWYHNITVLDKVSGPTERDWYLRMAIEHGWSRNVLAYHIEAGLFSRKGSAVTNFKRTLPCPRSDLAVELLKDPYSFDFLEVADDACERELERGLAEHLRDFLLELGSGFAFLGSQYRIEVSGRDYHVDLLFYHVHLHCYIVIDLKSGEFRPEHADKMKFYLSAVDDQLRRPVDGPSIGIILCRTRDRLTAEYALRDTSKPVGIATWRLMKRLPHRFTRSLPAVEEIERELGSACIEGQAQVRT